MAHSSGSHPAHISSPTPSNSQTYIDELDDHVSFLLEEPKSAYGAESIPCRQLHLFCIWDDIDGHPFLDFDSVLDGTHNPVGRGLARPWRPQSLDDDEEEEDEDGGEGPAVRVTLGAIFRVEIVNHREIWLQTSAAWYCLMEPHLTYVEFFEFFWAKHRAVCVTTLIVSGDPEFTNITTANEFMDLLEDYDENECPYVIQEAVLTIGRPLILEDFTDNYKFLEEELEQLDKGDLNLKHPVLLWLTQPRKAKYTRLGKRERVEGARRGIKRPKMGRKSLGVYLTPIVRSNAENLYGQHFSGSTMQDKRAQLFASLSADDDPQHFIEQIEQPIRASVQIGPNLILSPEADEQVAYHLWININGTKFKPGDFALFPRGILVEAKDHISAFEDKASTSTNKVANSFWFGRIVQIRSAHKTKGYNYNVHVQWFVHSSKSILQEGHHPLELLATMICDSVPAFHLHKKIEVELLGPGMIPSSENFFARALYNNISHAFTTLPIDFQYVSTLNDVATCPACVLHAEQKREKEPIFVPGNNSTMLLDGVRYHKGDFVYVNSKVGSKLLPIAQIVDFKISKQSGTVHRLILRQLHRLSTSGGREVVLNSTEFRDLPTKLAGKCWVVSHITWTQSKHKFLCDPHIYFVKKTTPSMTARPSEWMNLTPSDLGKCDTCLIEFEARMRPPQPLKIMDIFSGCGGTSQGFLRAEAGKVHWAVDSNHAAVETFRLQHPAAYVVEGDAGELLYRIDNGRERKFGEGGVDIIFITPPCPSFSRLNRFKKASDPQHTLVATGLAYVEHFHPRYVLIENVVGMLKFRLQGTDGLGGAITGGIQFGVHKFILRTLCDLGYQVRFAVLQAADYGCPQSRERLIYIAARHELSIPNLPTPSHHSSAHAQRVRLGYTGHASNMQDPTRELRPHSQVSVGAAISDLPRFDWHSELSPHGFVVNATIKECGPEDGPYPEGPLNHYQEWVRLDSPLITRHRTSVFSEEIMKRIVNVKMDPLADHRSLNSDLRIQSMIDITGAGPRNRLYPGCYGRVDEQGLFQTIVTRLNPSHRQGRVLHYNQRRVLTVREYARSQGFHDATEFFGSAQDAYRCIGNALPVPLSMALAFCFRVAHASEPDTVS